MNKEHKYNIVIYHKACNDGFASAYIAYKVLGNNAKYIPLSYYDKVPTFKNKNILVCDFSFDAKIAKKLIKKKNKIFFLDHHKTALEKLEDLPDKYKLLDMEHSGAYLTWKHFFPNKEIPLFVKLIQDYDLWQFKYKETKPFTLALDMLPYYFKRWKKLEDDSYVKNLIQKGKIIKLYQDDIVTRQTKSYRTCNHEIGNKKYKVIYRNSSSCVNEVANELVKNNNCDFAVTYHYDDARNMTRFNLRSIDSKADVSEVAKLLGGGGHRNASGLSKTGFHNTII